MADPLNVAKLRFDAGLTPEGLGAEIGISGRTIRRIEEGHVPGPAVAKKIADHFGVTPSELFPIPTTEAAA
jgi:transcriptional regulator with XRE-family HTH domain